MTQWKRKNRHLSRAVPPQRGSIDPLLLALGVVPAPRLKRPRAPYRKHLIGAHCEEGRRMREAGR